MTESGLSTTPVETEAGNGIHLVILVHGIRTFAYWQVPLKQTLEENGFTVEPTNYEIINIFQFLIPVKYFRNKAINRVRAQIRAAIRKHRNPEKLSFIAHSFGTWVLTHIICNIENHDIRASKIIFCGSVLPPLFPFTNHANKFDAIINEVGSHDILPALAESTTWGYGAAGTHGFQNPPVDDRWHQGYGHGRFFWHDGDYNKKFWEDFWIPFLQGKPPKSGDVADPPPWYIYLLRAFKLRNLYFPLGLFMAWYIWSSSYSNPETYHVAMTSVTEQGIRVGSYGYVTETLNSFKSDIDIDSETWWIVNFLKGRKQASISGWQLDATEFVICRDADFLGPSIRIEFKDPINGLRKLVKELGNCVAVDGWKDGHISVSENKNENNVCELRHTAKKVSLCNCSVRLQGLICKQRKGPVK